jgi:hypothetical protein
LQVEHFRPKKSAFDSYRTTGNKYDDGYWWLSFDWRNLRLCGQIGNCKKGNHFPLKAGQARCTQFTGTDTEDPYLLDPTDPRDPLLLTFNHLGHAGCSPAADTQWLQARVEFTVDRCYLNFPKLVDARRVVWENFDYLVNCYLTAHERQSKACEGSKEYDRAADEIRRRLTEISNMADARRNQLTCVLKAYILSRSNEKLVCQLSALFT